MPIRTGKEFLEGLRDDREVWLDGERVADVTTHPMLAGFAAELADVYDLQHDPDLQDLLTMASPTSGERVSLGYIVPTSLDELQRRRRMIEFLARRSGGTLGRLPEYMATIVTGLYDVRDILAGEEPDFATNITNYLEFCRENDVSLTHSFADAPRDARIPRSEFENLRLVERRSDGIVVSGVKSVATLAPFADEYIALAPNRPGLASDEIVYFAVPANTRGLRMYCRRSFAQPPSPDHPLSARFEELDSWVVFDNVFVPRHRVFYLQQTEVHLGLLNQSLPWAFYHILIRLACKAEVLAGICASVADYLGKDKDQYTQLQLCEMYGYVETLRAFLDAAEVHHLVTKHGSVIPNPTQITLGRIHSVDHHPRILQIVREICGSGILMAPGAADLAKPNIAADVDRYLVGPDANAHARYRMLKLAWEYASDSFGSRQLLFEMHNAGSQLTTKQRIAATYDVGPMKRLAHQLAGIDTDGVDASP
jgi:4-hydroxyphenylacetate 3-monooxygenase